MSVGEKFEVIDCSSESSEHPASNIHSHKGRWETDGACQRALVDIRFKQATQIGGISLLNISSSFVEVLVRNDPDKEFQVLLDVARLAQSQVLLPIRMVRSFHDVRGGLKRQHQHTFTAPQFQKQCLVKKWQIMRLSITQPWEEQPIGLSRVTVYNLVRLPRLRLVPTGRKTFLLWMKLALMLSRKEWVIFR